MRTRRKKRKSIIPIILIIVLLAAGYAVIKNLNTESSGQSGSSESAGSATYTAAPESSAETTAPGPDTGAVDSIKERMESMSLDEKIGQLVIAGVDGYENDEHSKQLIQKYKVGGFILFKRNIKNAEQMLSLLNSLKETNSDSENPLFLSIDEEGGKVTRMPDEFNKLPTNKKIGEIDNSELSYKIGSIIGEELNAFGMNMDFAPVLDINSNPKNPVIGDRAFGAEPGIVSRLGIQTMKGIQSQNVISVVKHFPGHGDTATDSHVGLPVVNHTVERLKEFELKPFADAIENNADAVMVAHILLPKLDAENPSSFSKAIISDILRKEMMFDGVVITDDFTMGAIVKNYKIGEAAVKSIQAGSDIVLVCHGFENQVAVIDALKNAAKTGELTEDRIDQSVYRILKLKNKYGISDEAAGGISPNVINEKMSSLFSKAAN